MPQHNCHFIETRLRHAEIRLNQIRTNINIYDDYLRTHPGHQPTIALLAELRKLEKPQENEVSNFQSELDNCKAQHAINREAGD